MIIRIIRVVVFCALLGSIVRISCAQEKQDKKVAAGPPDTRSGAELYAQHCAACHGSDLKGNGPFPPPYRVPPDLTTLALRHGRKFPNAYVTKVFRNGVTMPAHGPAEMPVWGTEFAATERLDKVQVTLRIKDLAAYIKSLQAK